MRKLSFGIAAVATGALLVLAGIWFYATYFVPEPPDAFTLDGATPTPSVAVPTAIERAPLDGTWEVSGGEGGYRVNEVLNGVNNTVAGRTEDVSGSLTIAGGMLVRGEIVVELAKVRTDNESRDGFFRGELELKHFPQATFSFEPGLDIAAIEDGDVTVTVIGKVTIHGVTREEPATIQARRAGNTVTVVGSIPVTFEDYGVSAPNFGFAVVESLGVIEVRLTFEPA